MHLVKSMEDLWKYSPQDEDEVGGSGKWEEEWDAATTEEEELKYIPRARTGHV